MKILLVRNSIDYIDIKHNTYNIQELGLARALTKKGHICDILFFTKGEEETIQINEEGCSAINVLYRKGKTLLYNAIYSDINSIVDNYDIIQTAEYSMYESWYLSKKYPHKTVVYHGPYYCSFNKKFNLMCGVFDIVCSKPFKRNNIPFIAKSELAASFLRKRGFKNITTVGVGIDLFALKAKESQIAPDILRELENYNSSLKILYVGRWDKRRNIIFMFDVLKLLISKYPETMLVMVGSPLTGAYGTECIEYAKKIGVYNHLIIIPKLEQCFLPIVYRACDVFILPTLYEIFGMVLLESMYFETPVITTQNGGSDMLIEHEKSGLKLPLIPELWVKEIAELYENKSYKEQITLNAKEKIINHFTWDIVSEDMIKVYNQLYKGNK